jgi:GntR family transcriptional regulator
MTETIYQDLYKQLKPSTQTSEPYYQQLTRKITHLIANGNLQADIGLPSERALADALNLSRTTVRRCYEELRKAGYIDSNGRAGTQVKSAPRVSPALGRLKGFTEEMRELGIVATTRVEAHDVLQDRTIASLFKRPSTTSFLRLVRIRLGDDVPMTREVAWYDLTLAPRLADWDTSGSAYTFLQDRCKIKLLWAEQSIEAAMSNAEESAIFGFAEASPCLLLKRKSFAAHNQLVEYVEGTFRGDSYTYRVKLEV